jgi:hypothetical protein
MHSSLFNCFIPVAFLTGSMAIAQSSNYHLEYRPVDEQSTRIVLVNDSSQTIEAFRMVQQCSLIRNSLKQDVLQTPVFSSAIRDAEGGTVQSLGPEHGGTWDITVFQNSEKSQNTGECTPHFDVVLFGDGTYEGDELSAHAMKVQRDGVVAGITEWQEILSEQNADGADVYGLANISSQREDDDRQKVHETFIRASSHHGDESVRLANEFWSGKMIVDSSIAARFHANSNGLISGQSFQRAKDLIEGWKAKVDADTAMKKLNELFPPFLPD